MGALSILEIFGSTTTSAKTHTLIILPCLIRWGFLLKSHSMNSKNITLYQKILGTVSAIFFAFFTYSIGDDALQTTFSGVGLLLKVQMLLMIVASLFGLWLLISKKQQSTVILVMHSLIFAVAVFVFFFL